MNSGILQIEICSTDGEVMHLNQFIEKTLRHSIWVFNNDTRRLHLCNKGTPETFYSILFVQLVEKVIAYLLDKVII